MRIHTDHHTADSIRAALRIAQDHSLIHPGVIITTLTAHGSRSHARAFEVQLGAPAGTPSFLADQGREYIIETLTGWGCPDDKAERAARRARTRRGHGGYGDAPADSPLGATWHEWGYFLAMLFAHDGTLAAGPYRGWMDFEDLTGGDDIPAWALANPAGRAAQGRLADFRSAVDQLPDPITVAESVSA